ncbi:Nucleophosmin [Heterocephalus glaber]|uniref:Nucleophosmin n=1 Tax=Heterocephalus glaber TaxID=10181 RepID=G5BQC1_HETGA|nr:Nucleophosmin [Heterocephalus glaber]
MEESMDMDMSPLRPQNYLFCCELKADKDYYFKVDIDENEHQLSLRTVSLGAGAKDELHIVEAEAMNYEGSPIKVTLATLKMSNQNGKDSKPSTPRSKGQESFKKQEKTPKTRKGPSSVEDIKAKMQPSIEKGGSLPKVEAKFINYVKNCFRMTDQEAIQDLWQWRKSL